MFGKRLVALGLALVFYVGFIGPIAAHTEVWERSPAAGQEFGGVIDQVQISFVASVESSEIQLIGPDDEPMEVGETRLESANRIAVVEFEELTEPGRYIVTHSELAADGDTQTDAYQFFFDPEGSETVVPLLGADGPNWPMLGIIAGVVLILAGLFWPGRSKTTATR